MARRPITWQARPSARPSWTRYRPPRTKDVRAPADGSFPMPPRIPVRWVALAILVVVALGLLRSRGAHPAQLATSCTTPGMKLSASQLSRASNVAFSAVGPSGGRYVITLDTQSLHRGAAGELMVEAEPRMAESARVLGDEFDMTGCRHNGRIPFFAGPGVAHTLQMFRVDGTPRGPYGGVSVEVDG